MWILYIAGFLAVLFYGIRRQQKKRRSCLSRKFSVLIRQLSKLDRQLAVQSSGHDQMKMLSLTPKGSIAILLSQYCNIISITVQPAKIQGQKQKKEWIFPDSQNQYAMFSEIVEELRHSRSLGFDGNLLDKWHQKNSRIMSKIILSNPYSFYNLPQSCFCISFRNAKKINDFRGIGCKGFFEVLFFNCASAVERNAFKGQDQLWEQLLGLLLFYLENHNLSYQINDIEKLMKNRQLFYTKAARTIRSDPNYNFNVLYHLFYIKPLYLVSPAKLKTIGASDFSKVLQGTGFSKKMFQMESDLEEKMAYLADSII